MAIRYFTAPILSEQDVNILTEQWERLAIECRKDRGYYLPFIQSPRHIAAIMSVIATSPRQKALFEDGRGYLHGSGNDGHRIDIMAAISQYHPEEMTAAYDLIVDYITAKPPHDLTTDDKMLLCYAASYAKQHQKDIITPDTLVALVDYCLDIAPLNTPQNLPVRNLTEMALDALISRLNHFKTPHAAEKCLSYVPLVMTAKGHEQFGTIIIEKMAPDDDVGHYMQRYKENIESYIATSFNILSRPVKNNDIPAVWAEKLYPRTYPYFKDFMREYGAQPTPKP